MTTMTNILSKIILGFALGIPNLSMKKLLLLVCVIGRNAE